MSRQIAEGILKTNYKRFQKENSDYKKWKEFKNDNPDGFNVILASMEDYGESRYMKGFMKAIENDRLIANGEIKINL